MNTLDVLVDRGIIDSDGYVPFPTEPITKCSVVLGQKYCENGVYYDVMISWLQKAIRRNLLDDALYCMVNIANMGGIFLSHVLNRLMVMVSEDIGAATIGLAEYAYDTYCEIWSRREDELCEENKTALMDLVATMCGCPKSRLADWSIFYGSKFPGNPTKTFEDALFNEDLVEVVRIILRDVDEKMPPKTSLTNFNRKRKLLWKYWNILLEEANGDSEVLYLSRLYDKRGDVLHLVHAVCYVLYGNPSRLVEYAECEREWDDFLTMRRPVLNSAIDKHTTIGRKYLGRNVTYFMDDGSLLSNEVKLTDLEDHLVAELKAYFREGEGYNDLPKVKKSPRSYQQEMIDTAVEYYKSNNSGKIIACCGSGKTLLSYWLDIELESKNTLVLVPSLFLLTNFCKVWKEQLVLSGKRVEIGIIGSDLKNTVFDDNVYYERITKPDDIENYLTKTGTSFGDRKLVFCTYASLNKLAEICDDVGFRWDFTIFDEAHHLGNKDEFVLRSGEFSRKRLFMTATETSDLMAAKFGDVIATYDFRDAINMGFLSDYSIKRICGNAAEEIYEALMNNKCNRMLVFSRKNALSAEKFGELDEIIEDDEILNIYLDGTIKVSDREREIERFKRADKSVIFSCFILGEGVDIPPCDGICFTYGKGSFVSTVQCFSRALRLDPDNPGKEAYILIIDTPGAEWKTNRMIDFISRIDPEVYNRINS